MRRAVGAALLVALPLVARALVVQQVPVEVKKGLLVDDGDEQKPDAWPPTQEETELLDAVAGACSRNNHRQLENAVVVYLITRASDVDWLIGHAMARSYRFFLERWPYPVVAFVPSDRLRKYDPKSYGESPTAEELRNQLQHIGLPKNIALSVEEFDLQFPKSLPTDWQSRLNNCASMVGTAYKHMNQFFTKGMYEHPALHKYKYYMRLDADILFTKNIAHDPFCMIKETGRKFMFQSRHHVRDPTCVEGMFDWFRDYAQSHNLTAKDRQIWRFDAGYGTYVGYIGVGDLDFFRQEKVRALADAFNADGRVYVNRWSDQTYYVLLLALMEPHSAVGDIGINWPLDSWCHKCKLPKATVGRLISEMSSLDLPPDLLSQEKDLE